MEHGSDVEGHISKRSHDEHMSGPDEEPGVSEPLSGHFRGKSLQTLRIVFNRSDLKLRTIGLIRFE